jgi:hypothetical protein
MIPHEASHHQSFSAPPAPIDEPWWLLAPSRPHHQSFSATPKEGGMTRADLIERIVDRVVYTIEQYTCGATEAISTLSTERYAAMCTACEQQVETLLEQTGHLAMPQATDAHSPGKE